MKKTQLSSLDLGFLVKELAEELVSAHIDKVYQIGERDLRITLRAGDKKELIITPSYMCLTKFEHEAPERPSNLAMILRKRLGGGRIINVEQHRFDRIVEMSVEGQGKLVIELFSRGNVILLDNKGIIENILEAQEWKDRTLKPGLPYAYPPETPDIRAMSVNEFAVKLSESREVVKTLASGLGLGATYANEALARAGVHPNARAGKEDIEKAYEAVRKMLESRIDAAIVFDGEEVDVVPFEMEIYRDNERAKKTSFNEAVDEYFTRIRAEGERCDGTKDFSDEIKRIERVMEKQKATAEEMRKHIDDFKEKGDAIYTRFQEIDSILKGIKDAKAEGVNWMEFLKDRGLLVRNPADRSFDFGGTEIFIDKSVPDNAAYYYEKSKSAKSKLEGAEQALRRSERELASAKAGKSKAEEELPDEPVLKPKKEWYEKFRWFVSSDGFLVIGGRDADSNELLIKRHTDPADLVFHSTVHGAPFFIVKNPDRKDIPESTKREAAEAAASYSSAWGAGMGSADVYAIGPEQVTKTPNSGEYLAKGAFVIRGEREWFKNTMLKVAVGFDMGNGARTIGGPVSAVKSRTKHYATVGVGSSRSFDIAKDIKASILRNSNKEDGQRIKRIEVCEVQKWIPTGKGMLLK